MLLLALALSAGATTYRAGLLQSKLSGATQWTAPAPTADAERTPGAVMAQFYVGSDAAAATDGYQNPWTGNTTYWNAQNTTFAYTGQMWMEGGTTYTFGKSLDDGARIEIDGTTVMENNSWNSWVTASYTPSYTGWHDVDIRVSDGNGGKGPCSSANGTWGTNYGLGWNTLGLTAANSALENWRWFLEDGAVNRFRVAVADCFSVDSVTKTATGFDFTVTAAEDVSVAVYRTASDDYMSAGSWTPAVGPVSVAAGATATISLVTADETPAAYQIGACDFPADGNWYYQFFPCGAVGSLTPSSVGGKTLGVTAILSDFGVGCDGATIRVEAATTPGFAEIVSASDEATVTATGTPQSFTLYGLSYDSTYYLRLRMTTAVGTVYATHGAPVTTASALFPPTTVFAAGLMQAQIDGAQENRTTAIADVADANKAFVPGTIMANTTGSGTDPAGKTWSWAGNRVFAYGGKMWMESGTTYTFGKMLDDWTYVVIDGAVLLDNNTWDGFASCNYTPAASGWVPVEFRFGNGGGGAGVSKEAKWGFAFNTEGNTTWDPDYKSGADPWKAALDPGDGSLFCVEYSPTPFMTVDSLAPAGGDLVLTASFEGVPAGGGVVQVLYGPSDGEFNEAEWANVGNVGTVPAGDTPNATFTVEGAGGAAFAAVRIVAGEGADTGWFQWSQIYSLAAESPSFGLVNTVLGYTNLTYTASCTGLGSGASSVEATLLVATDAEFNQVVQTIPLALAGIGGETVALTGFLTNTTYYARVVGTNDQQEAGSSGPVIVTTLDPQPPEGVSSFSGRGFTTLAGTALVSTFGTGSDSATIRFEASTDGFATIAGASADVPATVGAGMLLTIPGLAANSPYALRLRIENEWGLVAYVPVDGTYSTREAPLAATGIGYTAAADGSTVDFTFGVSEVFDGAECRATLEYDGRTVGEKTFSTAGPLAWNGVVAAQGVKTATVTVTSDVDGTTYTQSWTVSVDASARSYALSTLSELSGTVFHVGDSATLPELPGADDQYFVMDVRSFSLAADGLTLTALEPGFSAVVALKWSASAGAFVADPVRALAVCIPEPEGAGRVFFARPGNTMNWEDAAQWRNLSDPGAAADYPRRADDVAMVALPNERQVILNADATVGELYIGPDENNVHKKIRLTGKNSATLTFARSSGEPGLFRFTGHGRLGSSAVTDGWTELCVGGGDGNSTTTGLGIRMPGGLLFDGGAWPDYTAWDSDEMKNFGRARYIMGDNMRFWNIPEGKTLRIVNTYSRYKMAGDDQGGNANFCWGNGGQVTGSGTWLYDGASSTYMDDPFYRFAGVVAVRNKQHYDDFSMGSRGGSFWMVNWTTPTQYATNATLLVEGDATYNNGLSHAASYGVISYGNSHGYGSWGKTENAFPAKKWILNGGAARISGMADTGWGNPPVAVPNGAETLVVSNGFFAVQMFNDQGADRPTNVLHFASLEHPGDGTLYVSTGRLRNSSGTSLARDFFVVEGFADHAIGGSGVASYSTTDSSAANVLPADAPIVPWIVAPISNDDNVFFPGAAADGALVLAGWPANSVLNNVSDPTLNVSVDETSILLDHDVTVNSLRITKNRDKGRQLGEGRTLTITSGGLILGGGNIVYFDEEKDFTAGTQGTLNFPTKAWVYSTLQNTSEPNQIWSRMVAPQGAVFSYPGVLRLGGDQTGIDDHIAVNGTRLELGSATTGCEIDVPVHVYGANAKIVVNKAGAFCRQDLHCWDHGTPGAQFVAQAGTEEVVEKLWIDGVSMPRGYYGSSEAEASISALATGSHPAFVDDRHFSGTGWVKVLKDDVVKPTMLLIK